MKKNILKLKMLVLTALSVCCSSPLAAGNFEDYLDGVETQFRSASTDAEKYAVVSQPVNIEVLRKAESVAELSEEELKADVGPQPVWVIDEKGEKSLNHNKTNPLMLAIEVGDVHRVEAFLSVIEDVNNHIFTTWGYRQPYTPAHLALDPQCGRDDVPLRNREEIIDLLGKKGANFNQIIGHRAGGVYYNPPLLAGAGRGGYPITHEGNDQLRARSLLYGADPAVYGSSGVLVCINPTRDCPLGTFGREAKKLCKMAVRQLLDMSEEKKEGIRFADSVEKELQSVAKEVKAQVEEERALNEVVFQRLLTESAAAYESLRTTIESRRKNETVLSESDDEV